MNIYAFDLDHTLLKKNSSFEFGRFLVDQKVISRVQMLYLLSYYGGHAVGLYSTQRVHELNFESLFKGKLESLFQGLVARFLDKHLADLIYTPVYKIFSQALLEKHYVAILSASPHFLVEAVGQRLGAHFIASTIYHRNTTGHFSHLGVIMEGREKALVLQSLAEKLQIPKGSIYAYSDSDLDLPFMESAGHPVAARPNRRLKRIAKLKGWEII